MPLSPERADNEFNKFSEVDGLPALNVIVVSSESAVSDNIRDLEAEKFALASDGSTVCVRVFVSD